MSTIVTMSIRGRVLLRRELGFTIHERGTGEKRRVEA